MNKLGVTFRTIEEKDNRELADLIRNVFREFKIVKPGTVYFDPTTDDLFKLFMTPGSEYWVAEENGKLAGGCGIYPTSGLPKGCAELVKLYVSASQRGKGIGKCLLEKSIESAIRIGYNQLYLESLPELSKAIEMYKKAGFNFLPSQLGDSGHSSCDIWMIKNLYL